MHPIRPFVAARVFFAVLSNRLTGNRVRIDSIPSGGTTPTPNDSGFDSFGNFWPCDSGFDSHFKLANPESHGSGCNSQINSKKYELLSDSSAF